MGWGWGCLGSSGELGLNVGLSSSSESVAVLPSLHSHGLTSFSVKRRGSGRLGILGIPWFWDITVFWRNQNCSHQMWRYLELL